MTIEAPQLRPPLLENVESLDPLELDAELMTLPDLNAEQNVVRLQELTSVAVSRSLDLPREEAQDYAVIRDLDFLVSSLIRHGTNPLETTTALERCLMELSESTGSVPRGTVFTYADQNPTGDRRRSFTGSDEENYFIDAVRTSIRSMDSAVEGLAAITLVNDTPQDIVAALESSTESCGVMKDAIVHVHRTVSPEFFTFQMRPYFEPLVINGTAYTGSGGAQLQLLAVDSILWGMNDPDELYTSFYDENYAYLTPSQRRGIEAYKNNNTQSIVEYAAESNDSQIIAATIGLLRAIRKFRYPHKKVADNNFKLRGKEALGSGSHRPDILAHLIVKTEAQMQRLGENDA